MKNISPKNLIIGNLYFDYDDTFDRVEIVPIIYLGKNIVDQDEVSGYYSKHYPHRFYIFNAITPIQSYSEDEILNYVKEYE